MTTLSRRGPHRVLRGDLGIVGTPGVVFTPDGGERLPAVAFGHGWLTAPARYRDLMHHLASWGIVVAAPEGQHGVLASDVALAADLRSVLSIVSGVPLGFGRVTVDPARLGLAGHGFGAAAAVVAASARTLLGQPRPQVGGVAALFPAPTTADLLPAAATVTAPGIIVSGAAELDTVTTNALPLALAYGTEAAAPNPSREATRGVSSRGVSSRNVSLRTLAGAQASGLVERRTPASLIGLSNGADKSTHAAVRAVCTGFFLHTLTGGPEYQAFVDDDAVLGNLAAVDLTDPPVEELDKVARLFGAKPRKRGPMAKLTGAVAARTGPDPRSR